MLKKFSRSQKIWFGLFLGSIFMFTICSFGGVLQFNNPKPTQTRVATTTPKATRTGTAVAQRTATPTSTVAEKIVRSSALELLVTTVGLFGSCLTSIVSATGFVFATVINIRKESRETRQTQIELEKTRLEIDKLRQEMQEKEKKPKQG